uniref:Uncharacterized protein n=1 Tax=Ditylenchus dipsaci TaxID=166011 RepID=A0A915D978_9BILA
MELLGVRIGATAIAFVKDQLDIPIECTTLWTDSECVLHWLSSTAKLKCFERNQLSAIRSHKELIIRGASARALQEHLLWWNGPSFLQDCNQDNWPSNKLTFGEDSLAEYEEEEAPVFQLSMATLKKKPIEMTIDHTRFSKWQKLVNTTAYCLKFLRKTLQKQREKIKNPVLQILARYLQCV